MYHISSKTLDLQLDSTGRIISLRDSDYEFLSAQSHAVGIWQLGLIRPVQHNSPLPPIQIPDVEIDGHEWFTNREEYQADLLIDSNDCDAPVIESDDSQLSLKWTIDIPDGIATVVVTIDSRSDRFEFNMQLSLPGSWTIKRASYPRIRGFGDLLEPDRDALLFPENWGVLRHNPLEDQSNYSGQYPAYMNWCQMTAWLHGDRGVYIGMLDPESNHTGIDMQYANGSAPVQLENDKRNLHVRDDKSVPLDIEPKAERRALKDLIDDGAEPAIQLRCHHWPEMVSEWNSPYPVVLQGFTGSWYDAALIHKSWATKQRWCRRGLLADRDDASAALVETGLWFSQYGFAPWSLDPEPPWDFQKRMHKLLDFFGMPFGLHWYNWHNFTWHSNYPNHNPPVPGFEEVLKDLQEHGIKVMPYCNGRLLYRDYPNIDETLKGGHTRF
ncbi:MAG: DUF6259 domain-containing protein [Lentisphaeria bacterium]|nr:DUF6259 domain-containing protein [Lentisphaeria bacterium]